MPLLWNWSVPKLAYPAIMWQLCNTDKCHCQIVAKTDWDATAGKLVSAKTGICGNYVTTFYHW